MSVSVTREAGKAPGVTLAFVRAAAERMLAELGLGAAELSVLLTGDASIRKLNRQYRSKDRATDVLAFAMREGEPLGAGAMREGEMLGDVVISLETAARNGALAGRPAREEVRLLLAHGLLHLVGYDHQTDQEEREMQEATRVLVRVSTVEKPKKAG